MPVVDDRAAPAWRCAVADDRAHWLLGHVEGAAAAEIEDRHAWMVLRRRHLERYRSIEDGSVEGNDAIEVGRHRRHMVEPGTDRHATNSFPAITVDVQVLLGSRAEYAR
jgi:hypothetical protein